MKQIIVLAVLAVVGYGVYLYVKSLKNKKAQPVDEIEKPLEEDNNTPIKEETIGISEKPKKGKIRK